MYKIAMFGSLSLLPNPTGNDLSCSFSSPSTTQFITIYIILVEGTIRYLIAVCPREFLTYPRISFAVK